MEFGAFLDKAVAGVPLLFVVLGLVEWFKSFKDNAGKPVFEGNFLLLLSMGIGAVLGSMYMLTVARPPAEADQWTRFVYWFGTIFYGLALGLVASGLYDTIKNLVTKIVERKS